IQTNIIDSNNDLIDSNNDFIALSSSFGVYWTVFLHSKQFKNNKAHQYNAKYTHCDQIFEAHKDSMKSSNKTIEESTDTTSISSSTLEKNNAGLMTNYFYKAAILLTKIDELHTLLLHALIYNVSNNSIYAFILYKSEDINEIINIDDFSSIRHTASNLLVAIETSLQNISINFNKIITIVTDIQNYEAGFQACLEYNNNSSSECLPIPTKIKEIIFSHNMLVYALTFAQKWNFTHEQAQQISKTLLDYYNNEPPFNLIGDLKPQ
ncbi:23966_t:CDS:2, partial [Gigaspora rosea]